jgi:ABC-2 type transport system permease protein
LVAAFVRHSLFTLVESSSFDLISIPSYNHKIMARTIFQYEFKQLLRNKVLWGMALFLVLCSAYAIGYGWRDYQQFSNQISEVQQKQAETYQKLLPRYDSLSKLGEKAPQALKGEYGDPSMADWFYRRYATWTPSTLSALAIGQRDQQTPFQRIRMFRNVLVPELEEINNPEQLLTGNFDLGFVLVYLLPLLLIVLGFNALSHDREQGILALVQVQGVRPAQLMRTRLLLHFLILWGMAALLITVAFTWVNADWQQWPLWVIATGLWLLFWSGILAWVNQWRQSSAFNATVLAGSWILILILLPAAVNFLNDKVHPIEPPAEFMAAARDIEYQEWERPVAQVVADFRRLRPDLSSIAIRDTQAAQIYFYNEVIISKINLQGTNLQTTRFKRMALEKNTALFNPAYAYHTLLTQSAGSEIGNYEDWFSQVKQVSTQNRDYLRSLGFNKKLVTRKELDELPVYKASLTSTSVLGNLLLMLILCLITWGLAAFQTGKALAL